MLCAFYILSFCGEYCKIAVWQELEYCFEYKRVIVFFFITLKYIGIYMKRLIMISLVLILLFSVSVISVSAYDAVGVDIRVDVINGGTVNITSQVNSPLPDKSELKLSDKESGMFHIDFDDEGIYNYYVRIKPDDRDIVFDETVYNVVVYVNEEDGKLFPTVVVYYSGSDKKYESPEGFDNFTLVFDNTGNIPTEPLDPTIETSTVETGSTEDESKETDNTVKPTQANAVETQPHNKNDNDSKPKTGDDSTLDFYLVLAIIASAGLFMLSLIYYYSVTKSIKEKRNI